MRHLIIMLLVGFMSFAGSVEYAEAKRFGGGKSFGSYSRSAQPATPARTQSATTPPRQPSAGLSRFAGPLAGMMAGGLLAALFFGGAFDGIRFMDMILIAIVAFIAFRLLAAMRQKNTAAQSGHQNAQQSFEQPYQARENFNPATGGSFATGSTAPKWFDQDRFLADAKAHFMTLQRAWDNNDLEKIQDYVTPSLYNLLKEERKSHDVNNRTEIVRLFAEIGSVTEQNGVAEASVLFHGVLEENGENTEFNETWHLTRTIAEDAPWYIQGIEQNPA